MITISTGLGAGMLNESGFRQMMYGGVIYVYAGTRAVTADEGISEDPIGVISQNGAPWSPGGTNGLELDMLYPTALQKQGSWMLDGKRTGTAVWARFCGPGQDSNTFSIQLPRVDMDCGMDLILPTYEITPVALISIQSFVIGFRQFFS